MRITLKFFKNKTISFSIVGSSSRSDMRQSSLPSSVRKPGESALIPTSFGVLKISPDRPCRCMSCMAGVCHTGHTGHEPYLCSVAEVFMSSLNEVLILIVEGQ